jgi:hypothetical protein
LHGAGATLAPRGMRRAEHEFLDGAVELLAAGGTDVGLRGLGCQHRLLGTANTVENGRIAAEIAKYADAQIDLVGRGIRAKFCHETQYRVRLEAA